MSTELEMLVEENKMLRTKLGVFDAIATQAIQSLKESNGTIRDLRGWAIELLGVICDAHERLQRAQDAWADVERNAIIEEVIESLTHVVDQQLLSKRKA